LCPARSSAQSSQTGTITVTKTAPSVTSQGVTVLLTIKNNGSIPINNFQIYEYFNTAFVSAGNGVITTPSGQSTFTITVSRLASTSQQIIVPPPPDTLNPGQKMSIQYTESAPAGDYTVPQALVWYSYTVSGSTTTANVYSNSLFVHIPSQFEAVVRDFYPYILAITAFFATMTILLWARSRLAKLGRRNLFRENGPAI